MKVARRLTVRGHVQGVFFRKFVSDRAVDNCVVGWAANRFDGSVEVWLEGAPEDVAAVEAAVAQGPPGARVDAVEAQDAAAQGVLGFQRR